MLIDIKENIVSMNEKSRKTQERKIIGKNQMESLEVKFIKYRI